MSVAFEDRRDPICYPISLRGKRGSAGDKKVRREEVGRRGDKPHEENHIFALRPGYIDVSDYLCCYKRLGD